MPQGEWAPPRASAPAFRCCRSGCFRAYRTYFFLQLDLRVEAARSEGWAIDVERERGVVKVAARCPEHAVPN